MPAFFVSFSDLLANSSDPDLDTLTVSAISGMVGGTAQIVNGGVMFLLNPNYNGTVSFSFTVDDGFGGTATASASFAVTPVNDLPTTVADSAAVGENTTALFNLVANDYDVEDGRPTLAGFTVTGVSGIALTNAAATAAFSIENGQLKFNPGNCSTA